MFRSTLRWMFSAALAATSIGVSSANAASFPDRQIELVVPYEPGGSTDGMARIVAPRLAEVLKVPVVIINRQGAAGAIGTSYALQSTDGYRVFAAGNTNLGPLLVVGQKPNYDLNDVTGIARFIINPLVVVTKNGKFSSFEDFLKTARDKPDQLTFASWGLRSPSHFYGELLSQQLGIKIRHIPYNGGAKAMLAAMSGEIDIAIVTAATARAAIKAGTLTGLAVSTESELPDLPSVKSIKTLGYPDAVLTSFEGFGVSSKVPPENVEVLRKAFNQVLNEPKIQAAIREMGSEPSYLSGQDYDVFLRKNQEILKNVATKARMED